MDGGQHSERLAQDQDRTAWLEARGYRVLRFWNDQVLKETEAVLEAILEACEPPPQSSPAGGGGESKFLSSVGVGSGSNRLQVINNALEGGS